LSNQYRVGGLHASQAGSGYNPMLEGMYQAVQGAYGMREACKDHAKSTCYCKGTQQLKHHNKMQIVNAAQYAKPEDVDPMHRPDGERNLVAVVVEPHNEPYFVMMTNAGYRHAQVVAAHHLGTMRGDVQVTYSGWTVRQQPTKVAEMIRYGKVQLAVGGCHSVADGHCTRVLMLCRLAVSRTEDSVDEGSVHYVDHMGVAHPFHHAKLIPTATLTVPAGSMNATLTNIASLHLKPATYVLYDRPVVHKNMAVEASHDAVVGMLSPISVSITKTIADLVKGSLQVNSVAGATDYAFERHLAGRCTLSEGVVDLTGSLLLLDSKHKQLEKHATGARCGPTQCNAPLNWPGTASRAVCTIELAPAFASLASVWLDRSTINALGVASTWIGLTRNIELDSASRSAIRAAAHAPLELTRFYVRLWALWFSSAQAQARGAAYNPVISSSGESRVSRIETLSAWCSALRLASQGLDSPIFYDQHAAGSASDVLAILRLITSERLEDAGLANWLWPSIPKARLYHNTAEQVTTQDRLCHTTISAAVMWLVNMTDTKQQATDAYNLVNSLAMRPLGWGIFGPGTEKCPVTIALPHSCTLGQLLAPFSLATTTMDSTMLQYPTPSQIVKPLMLAAIAGCEYTYSIAAVAAATLAQDWWPSPLKDENQNQERHMCATADGTWRLGIAAARLRQAICENAESCWIANVRTARIGKFRSAQFRRAAGAKLVIGSVKHLYADDPATALFAKLTPRMGSGALKLKKMAKISVIGGGLQSWHATETLSAVGAQLGLITVDELTNTIADTKWISRDMQHGIKAPDSHCIENERTYLVTKFSSAAVLTQFWALNEQRAAGHWFYEQNDIDSPDTINEESTVEGLDMPTVPIDEPGPATATIAPSAEGPEERLAAEPAAGTTPAKSHGPPQSIIEAAPTDRLIKLAVDNAACDPMQPNRVTIGPGAYTTWQIPPAIAHDNEAIAWLRANLDPIRSQATIYDPNDGVSRVANMLDEQRHLNTVRDIAGALPDPPDEKHVVRQVETLLEAIVPQAAVSKESGDQAAGAVASPVERLEVGSMSQDFSKRFHMPPVLSADQIQTLAMEGRI
jgi:hypothetical protein